MQKNARSPLFLNVFRLVVAIRFVTVFFLTAAAHFWWQIDDIRLFVASGLILLTGLITLSVPRLLRGLGNSYAFWLAIVLMTSLVLERRVATDWLRTTENGWFWLPGISEINFAGLSARLALIVLVAWGYSGRQTFLYCTYTLAFDMILLVVAPIPQNFLGADLRTIWLSFIACLVVALVVHQLVLHQQRQHHELEAAHQHLAQYSVALEKLSISRERNRLARELHDTLAHTLSAATVKLNAMNIVWDTNPAKARAMLSETITMMNEGMTEVRRALRDLRSTPLEDLGLSLALSTLVESMAQRGAFHLEVSLPGTFVHLTPDDEQGIYRIVQEAFENVVRHANARHVWFRVEEKEDRYHFTIRDDGVGFEVSQVYRQSRFGLNGMLHRALLMRSILEIISVPGKGTTLKFAVEKRP